MLVIVGSVVLAVLVLGSAGTYLVLSNHKPTARAVQKSTARPAPTTTTTATAEPTAYVAPTGAAIAALPEAMYSAVIPGLMAYSISTLPTAADAAYRMAADTPIYGTDRSTLVARFSAKNFMELDSVVVPVELDGAWTLVLTPARQQLPSKNNGQAPAQTVGWVRTSALTKDHALPEHVVVSVSRQTISIANAAGVVEATYSAGVGTSSTPTPTDVVGYLEARYLDPSQGQAVHPIQLTSLHASAADDPYLGHDGGLIGLHYNASSTGSVSHGCVRLGIPAIDAVNALPLGTLITLVP